MSFLEQLKARKTCLHSCETVVKTPSGHCYKEKVLADGTSVTSQLENCTSLGYVVDTKPDLQVALVLPGLYMGSQDVVHDISLLKRHSVTHVLSLGIKPVVLDQTIIYKYIKLLDVPETNLVTILGHCFSFIDNAIITGGHVFVHCNAGISRSASVVIAYLMKKQGMNYKDAYLHLKEKRNIIKPNPGFVQQLKDYELTITVKNE